MNTAWFASTSSTCSSLCPLTICKSHVSFAVLDNIFLNVSHIFSSSLFFLTVVMSRLGVLDSSWVRIPETVEFFKCSFEVLEFLLIIDRILRNLLIYQNFPTCIQIMLSTNNSHTFVKFQRGP